ncbi:uncharacterized protein LOC134256798, partial [Saccostrea cucullata]|uniref:uncharacterized protein LOC134256798 n=1 Tax=Saccostrea cuccullata TaxID=36930 RepID=UPI002ED6AE71
MASNTSNSERSYQHFSVSVYWALHKIVGSPHQVAMRRDLLDIVNILDNHTRAIVVSSCISGSSGEGFRLNDSDVDIINWPNNHRVIWDLSQVQYYNVRKCGLIVADSSDSPPGYTLLCLPKLNTWLSNNILFSCIRMNDRYYVSSCLHKEYVSSLVLSASVIHGPCSFHVSKHFDFDHANCFAYDFWPPSASTWIDRCHSHSWPKPRVVHDIITSGCHVVAVGYRLGNHQDNEWRISLSKAEKRLVHTMNHCQFLSYGLLKLFLNEVINFKLNDESKLLCSYHVNTANFWMLQENIMSQWNPQNLLECFWICFKLILNWVYEGVCPNFFIPENNMFLTKIYGHSQ